MNACLSPAYQPRERHEIAVEAEAIGHACDLVSDAVDTLSSTVILDHKLDRERIALRRELDKFHEKLCGYHTRVDNQE